MPFPREGSGARLEGLLLLVPVGTPSLTPLSNASATPVPILRSCGSVAQIPSVSVFFGHSAAASSQWRRA
eukprot:scaffold1272_cov250-Pinguiococcus_pyrenoidosus.AAC.31